MYGVHAITISYNSSQYKSTALISSAPVQGSSSHRSVSGPVFLSPSVGLDVHFLSHDRFSNVLNGDDSCLHLANHGLLSSGLSASEAR
jgi:hypothetical protein